MATRIAIALVLVPGCLQPPQAPTEADLSTLIHDASESARACDVARAHETYERAAAACGKCTPWLLISLEQVGVEVALMNGQERAPTLASSTRLATRFVSTDPVVAASLLGWLGRWDAPELLERAARALAHVEPSAGADSRAALSVLLTDPDFVTHSQFGRTWPVRYELQHYHWQAPGSIFTRDDRYDLAACKLPAKRLGSIPDFRAQLDGQYAVYQSCEAAALPRALPGQRVAASASVRLMTDPSGAVSRIDVHSAFLPAVLTRCFADTLRNHHWGATQYGAIEEANIHFSQGERR